MSDRSNGNIPTPSLNLELSGPGSGVLDALFTREALSCGAVHFDRVGWFTEVSELPALGETITSTTRLSSETRLVSQPGTLALITFSTPAPSGRHRFEAVLAASDRVTLDELSSELHALLPEARSPEDRKVEIRFWSGGDEVTAISKRLAVEPWGEIEANYAAPTRADLAGLMRDFRPGEGGKLLLWHGEPGTGKTYALRTLAWEWRQWCDFHYVIDPEALLGPHSSYLVRVLLNDDSRLRIARESGSRWRLLILEDCGELLAADAKVATGQGLSRLLNLTDYYHHSFKAFGLQPLIERARSLLAELAPADVQLNEWFTDICHDALNHSFEMRRSNANWQIEVRPILEAFWHCQYFLEQMLRYGQELDEPPQMLPSGWAAILHLYGQR